MPSAEDMQVEMKHRLSAVRSGVRDNAVAGLSQVLHCCNLGAGHQQMPQ